MRSLKLRYSLRTFLLVIALVACWLGYHLRIINQRREMLSWVADQGGSYETYLTESQSSDDAPLPPWHHEKTAQISRFRAWFGDSPIRDINLGDSLAASDARQRVEALFPEAKVVRSNETLYFTFPGYATQDHQEYGISRAMVIVMQGRQRLEVGICHLDGGRLYQSKDNDDCFMNFHTRKISLPFGELTTTHRHLGRFTAFDQQTGKARFDIDPAFPGLDPEGDSIYLTTKTTLSLDKAYYRLSFPTGLKLSSGQKSLTFDLESGFPEEHELYFAPRQVEIEVGGRFPRFRSDQEFDVELVQLVTRNDCDLLEAVILRGVPKK